MKIFYQFFIVGIIGQIMYFRSDSYEEISVEDVAMLSVLGLLMTLVVAIMIPLTLVAVVAELLTFDIYRFFFPNKNVRHIKGPFDNYRTELQRHKDSIYVYFQIRKPWREWINVTNPEGRVDPLRLKHNMEFEKMEEKINKKFLYVLNTYEGEIKKNKKEQGKLDNYFKNIEIQGYMK